MLSFQLAAALFLFEPPPEAPPTPNLGECALPEPPESDVRDEPLTRHGLRFTPHYDVAGVFDGYRLSNIRRGARLHTLGLKNGDVIREINGQPFTGVSQAAVLFVPTPTAHLTVKRRNRLLALDLSQPPAPRPKAGVCG